MSLALGLSCASTGCAWCGGQLLAGAGGQPGRLTGAPGVGVPVFLVPVVASASSPARWWAILCLHRMRAGVWMGCCFATPCNPGGSGSASAPCGQSRSWWGEPLAPMKKPPQWAVWWVWWAGWSGLGKSVRVPLDQRGVCLRPLRRHIGGNGFHLAQLLQMSTHQWVYLLDLFNVRIRSQLA